MLLPKYPKTKPVRNLAYVLRHEQLQDPDFSLSLNHGRSLRLAPLPVKKPGCENLEKQCSSAKTIDFDAPGFSAFFACRFFAIVRLAALWP